MKYLIPLLLLTNLAFGQLSNMGIIPAIAHSEGAKGTFWRSDCYLFNNMDEEVTVDLTYYPTESLQEINKTIILSPKEVGIFPDIVQTTFEREGYGMLLMDASNTTHPQNPSKANIGLQCRTYTTDTEGGSYGMFILNQVGYGLIWPGFIYGVENNLSFRANLGLACPFFPSTIHISYYDSSGALLGEEDVAVNAFQIVQFRIPYDMDGGSIAIESLNSSSLCYAYVTVIDNVTGDSSFLPSQWNLLQSQQKIAKESKLFERFLKEKLKKFPR